MEESTSTYMKMVDLSPWISGVILFDSVSYSVYIIVNCMIGAKINYFYTVCDMNFKLDSIEIKEDT
jgi:hypothetical protein